MPVSATAPPLCRATKAARFGRLARLAGLTSLTLLAVSSPALAQNVCQGISEAGASPLTTVRVAAGLSRPVFVTTPPGDTTRLFIVEQGGTIRILRNGALLPTPFLDISSITRAPGDPGAGNEEGLLGLAFHPQYATNGFFFVYHTDNTGANNVVARYTRSAANPDVATVASRTPVISFAHPTFTNHNGGMIAFGPADGFLYIGTGDGGLGCDPGPGTGNAQSITSNLGKLLRINVNALPYTIPLGNPYLGVPGNDEIWAIGLRNPWRWSFDPANGDLYIGDVGQDIWEEVNWTAGGTPGGRNYGWAIYEAEICPNPSCSSDCALLPPAQHEDPFYSFTHTGEPGGCSVTGGYVYRGCRMPGLRGTYFFADYCGNWIRSARIDRASGEIAPGTLVDRTAELAPGGGLMLDAISSFGTDARGEVYVVGGGEVFKIIPAFAAIEVSGRGAAQPFLLGSGAWTWEDIDTTSEYTADTYQVYRAPGVGEDAIFQCVFTTAATSWPGGDTADPAAGQAFYYVVVALRGAERSSPGQGTGGEPRLLANCP